MGFFSKIFRRKETTTQPKQRTGVRLGRRNNNNNNKYNNNNNPVPLDDRDDAPTDTNMEPQPTPRSPRDYVGGPVDLDEFEASTVGGGEEQPPAVSVPPTHHQHPSLRLSSERLAEFTQQQEPMSQSPRSPNSNSNNLTFTMESEPLKPNTSTSSSKKMMFSAGHIMDDHSESSSFNLSTDAEDTEYEDLKKHGIVRKNNAKAAKNMLHLSSADTTASSFVSSPSHYYQTDGEGTVFPNLLTDDEGTSAGLLLQNSQEKNTRSVSSPRAWSAGGSKASASPTANGSVLSREVASPKSSQQDEFANFADFSSFGNNDTFASNNPVPEEERPPSPRVQQQQHQQQQRSRSFTRSTPASDSSISELLAQAKSKTSRGQRSGNSVNSAPAMTAAQIRAHHGIKPRTTEYDGTSVSDIIKSLEADNANRSRQSSGNKRHSDTYSTHSRDASVAKERLRRRRERRRHQDDGSTDSDDESWLMDEVTGALGPRGIAADLESLSGRSHRSHHSRKSRPSNTTTRRRTANSGESVDSHGSKRSASSRRSRYSHRSTKSYMSQMSEQSRSVANDLLRLEMQLAMVNPSSVLNPDSTRTSRSRRSGGSTRSRISVVAPPGKLGIILANKADSRGTVVSGVRTSSALADRISPGDRIVAIDGEDVSLMTVSEITTIMARKSEYDRTLTVLTTPKLVVGSSPESPREPRR